MSLHRRNAWPRWPNEGFPFRRGEHLHRSALRAAFTLVEMLVAITVTLLLMAALAKSFAVIGEATKEGRSQVKLSGKMRGISFRLRRDLGARTVDARPPIQAKNGLGYFMYYEGPLTEHTFGLFGAEPTRTSENGDVYRAGSTNDADGDSIPDFYDPDIRTGPTYRRLSRFGDFDDYLAFTAEATGDDWFTGKVPAYLVDDEASDPMEPRIIRSKYAEIIVWASPRWQVDASSNSLLVAPHPSAMPLYLDEDNDLAPDDIVLHQRILLIRPDLNVRRTITNGNANEDFDSSVLRPLQNHSNPARVPSQLEKIYPIGLTNPASTATPAPSPLYGTYAVPGSGGANPDNRLLLQSNWLMGMTPLHHFFDLSLRRITHPDTGEPTAYVAANSLQDLVQPHNRFAHVRYPGRYMGRGTFSPSGPSADDVTSMPLLALGWNDFILNWQGSTDPRGSSAAAPNWFPVSHPSPRTANGGTAANASGLFNGWLLPHFELGDANPVGTSSGGQWERGYLVTADSRWDRTGEDVIASNVLAFDIKGFDPEAPMFLTSGPDGEPGEAGINDDFDANNTTDETSVITVGSSLQVSSELGTIGSDDAIIGTGDIGIFNVLGSAILNPNPGSFPADPPDHQMLASRGDFVDLLYPYLAGTPLLQRTMQTEGYGTPAFPPSTPENTMGIGTNSTVGFNYDSFMTSDLSLFPIQTTAMNSMKRSGKLVHYNSSGRIWYFQPTYDTWTNHYEYDNFDQTHNMNGNVSQTFEAGTVWVLNDVSGLQRTPRLTSTSQASLQIDTGRAAIDDPETSAPISTRLPAVSISVRLTNSGEETFTEFRIVEDLQ